MLATSAIGTLGLRWTAHRTLMAALIQSRPGGSVMQLVKATDFKDVIDAFVNGVANMEEIAPGVVRVSYFIEKEDTYEGDRERKIVNSQIWSLPQLMDNLLVMQKVLKEMRPCEGSRS